MLLPVSLIAKLSDVSYMRAYRFLNGGSVALKPEQIARVQRVLRFMAECGDDEAGSLVAE
jgi:hypothetical protein